MSLKEEWGYGSSSDDDSRSMASGPSEASFRSRSRASRSCSPSRAPSAAGSRRSRRHNTHKQDDDREDLPALRAWMRERERCRQNLRTALATIGGHVEELLDPGLAEAKRRARQKKPATKARMSRQVTVMDSHRGSAMQEDSGPYMGRLASTQMGRQASTAMAPQSSLMGPRESIDRRQLLELETFDIESSRSHVSHLLDELHIQQRIEELHELNADMDTQRLQIMEHSAALSKHEAVSDQQLEIMNQTHGEVKHGMDHREQRMHELFWHYYQSLEAYLGEGNLLEDDEETALHVEEKVAKLAARKLLQQQARQASGSLEMGASATSKIWPRSSSKSAAAKFEMTTALLREAKAEFLQSGTAEAASMLKEEEFRHEHKEVHSQVLARRGASKEASGRPANNAAAPATVKEEVPPSFTGTEDEEPDVNTQELLFHVVALYEEIESLEACTELNRNKAKAYRHAMEVLTQATVNDPITDEVTREVIQEIQKHEELVRADRRKQKRKGVLAVGTNKNRARFSGVRFSELKPRRSSMVNRRQQTQQLAEKSRPASPAPTKSSGKGPPPETALDGCLQKLRFEGKLFTMSQCEALFDGTSALKEEIQLIETQLKKFEDLAQLSRQVYNQVGESSRRLSEASVFAAKGLEFGHLLPEENDASKALEGLSDFDVNDLAAAEEVAKKQQMKDKESEVREALRVEEEELADLKEQLRVTTEDMEVYSFNIKDAKERRAKVCEVFKQRHLAKKLKEQQRLEALAAKHLRIKTSKGFSEEQLRLMADAETNEVLQEKEALQKRLEAMRERDEKNELEEEMEELKTSLRMHKRAIEMAQQKIEAKEVMSPTASIMSDGDRSPASRGLTFSPQHLRDEAWDMEIPEDIEDAAQTATDQLVLSKLPLSFSGQASLARVMKRASTQMKRNVRRSTRFSEMSCTLAEQVNAINEQSQAIQQAIQAKEQGEEGDLSPRTQDALRLEKLRASIQLSSPPELQKLRDRVEQKQTAVEEAKASYQQERDSRSSVAAVPAQGSTTGQSTIFLGHTLHITLTMSGQGDGGLPSSTVPIYAVGEPEMQAAPVSGLKPEVVGPVQLAEAFNFGAASDRQSSCSSDSDDGRPRDIVVPPPPPPTPCESKAVLGPPTSPGFFGWLARRFSSA